MNIVVVEDNDDLRDVLVDVLCAQGHQVCGVDSAEALLEYIGRLELVVLDLNLPGEDGLSVAKRLRASHPQVGIIMVTARGMPAEKKAGYEHGADIYMVKPVSHDELCAAVGALSRRLTAVEAPKRMRVNPLALTLEGLGAQVVSLNPQQLAVLEAFARAPDQRMESWQIIDILGQQDAQDPKAALELQMVRLRKKLHEAGAAAPAVQAVRGWGYQLCVGVVVL